MSPIASAYLRHRQQRWMQSDSGRWVRPDVGRYLAPGTDPADVFPALSHKTESTRAAVEDETAVLIAHGRALAERTQHALTAIRCELTRWRLAGKYDELRQKYRRDQPRVPGGNPDGGQWTDAGGGASSSIAQLVQPMGNFDIGDVSKISGSLGLFEIRPREEGGDELVKLVSEDGKPLLDSYGEPYYQRGGHHEMMQGIYKAWDLPRETRRVFDRGSTGKLPEGYTDIEGKLTGHYWDREHRDYESGLKELSERFLRENKIETSRMTPDQARGLLKEIRESDDPRIRDYNRAIRMLRRIFRMRGGRE